MSVLYVDEQGAEIHRSGESFVVKKDGVVLAEMPATVVDLAVIAGNIGITTPAFALFFEKNIPVSFISTRGRFRGKLTPPTHKNASLRFKQYERYRDEAFLSLQRRAIIMAKLTNLRTFLQKHGRNNPDEQLQTHIDNIGIHIKKLTSFDGRDELMGVEGTATREYFSGFGKLINDGFSFTGRNRRPPKDPVNALLSLGYTLLFKEAYWAVEAIGLDPYIGVLHETDYGRPSLAVDLVEEFRFLVDGVALTLINKGMLHPKDFTPAEDNGVYLNEKGRQTFYEQYEKRINSMVSYNEMTINYRRVFVYQAQHLARVILGEEPLYKGFAYK